MTRFPREPLDADERALAEALPRLHGRSEPDAALDARILSTAHAAAQSTAQAPASTRAQRRWGVPLGLAASLCLALGLAWRVQLSPPQPTPSQRAGSPVTTAARQPAPDDDRAAAHAKASASMSVATATPPAAPPPPAVARAMQEMREAPPIVVPDMPAAPAPLAMPESVAAAPPPPAVMPAEAARPLPRLASPASPAPPAPPTPAAPAMAAKVQVSEAAAGDADGQGDAPIEDVPPASMAAPEVRAAWLRRIGDLLRQGRLDEARSSLAEFRRRYPEAVLPAELRPLEQTMPTPATH